MNSDKRGAVLSSCSSVANSWWSLTQSWRYHWRHKFSPSDTDLLPASFVLRFGLKMTLSKSGRCTGEPNLIGILQHRMYKTPNKNCVDSFRQRVHLYWWPSWCNMFFPADQMDIWGRKFTMAERVEKRSALWESPHPFCYTKAAIVPWHAEERQELVKKCFIYSALLKGLRPHVYLWRGPVYNW